MLSTLMGLAFTHPHQTQGLTGQHDKAESGRVLCEPGYQKGIRLFSMPHTPFIWTVGVGTDFITTLSCPLGWIIKGRHVVALLDMDSDGGAEFVGCLLTPRNVEISPVPTQ